MSRVPTAAAAAAAARKMPASQRLHPRRSSDVSCPRVPHPLPSPPSTVTRNSRHRLRIRTASCLSVRLRRSVCESDCPPAVRFVFVAESKVASDASKRQLIFIGLLRVA